MQVFQETNKTKQTRLPIKREHTNIQRITDPVRSHIQTTERKTDKVSNMHGEHLEDRAKDLSRAVTIRGRRN